MKLYEIDEAIKGEFDPETGEVLDEKGVENLKDIRREKLIDIGLWVKNMKADVETFKNEIENLSTRKKTLENKITNISKFLQTALNGTKINEPTLQISYRKSQALQIIDEDKVPQEFKKVVEVTSIDKIAIKEKIKSGEFIAGVAIEEKQNMIIK